MRKLCGPVLKVYIHQQSESQASELCGKPLKKHPCLVDFVCGRGLLAKMCGTGLLAEMCVTGLLGRWKEEEQRQQE